MTASVTTGSWGEAEGIRSQGSIRSRASPICSTSSSAAISSDEEGRVAGGDGADNLWRVAAEPKATAAYVRHELTFDQFRDLGEIEGIDFDPAAGEMLVLANRGKRIVLGMPKGLYPGYEREISEVYVFRVTAQLAPEAVNARETPLAPPPRE